ncbi:response regulator transcription factor [Chloroflexota bacterium]
MNESEDKKQIDARIELLAIQVARSQANATKWNLNTVILLFAVLITIIILVTQGIGNGVIVPLAVLGLIAVWVIGQRRGRQLYQSSYAETLSGLQQKPGKEAVTLEAQLTSRELQVLNYIAKGYANKIVAFELGISKNTIKSFVSSILTKLNANDRTEAVVIAIKHGLIEV